MAYTHSKYEVVMTPGGNVVSGLLVTTLDMSDLGTTGVAARWAPGYVPHAIKGAAVRVIAPTTALTNIVYVGFEADISTAGTATRMFTIALPTAPANIAHKSIYWEPRASNYGATTLPLIIEPGRQVNARVTAAEAGVRAHVILYVEPVWEEAGNITGMTLSTTV